MARRGLTKGGQHWLWALSDEALVDWEDHLLATKPQLGQELQERRKGPVRLLEDDWRAISQGARSKSQQFDKGEKIY